VNDDKFRPTDEVVDAVENLLGIVIHLAHDAVSGDTFVDCGMCGVRDEHAPACPVPVLKAWQEEG